MYAYIVNIYIYIYVCINYIITQYMNTIKNTRLSQGTKILLGVPGINVVKLI